jgi:phospholipid/cholesterol/gamma-HCH transport system substrate-binding protein
MSQRSIEVKVGILILCALGLLGAFIVVMGGLSFQPTYTVYVDFDNPGGLQSGAPVRIAGIKVGHVAELRFRGGLFDPKTHEAEAPIRVVAKVDKQYQKAIRANSRWYVTSEGVLGEQFLAVEPGSNDQPMLQDGAHVTGVSPPRLDLLLSESYELLHKAYEGITQHSQELSETFDGLHDTLKGTGDFFKHNQGKLDQIVSNVNDLTVEAKGTVKDARQRFVDGPQITRIMNNVDHTTSTLNSNLGPLMTDGRKVLGDASKLTTALASNDQIAKYKKITNDVSEATGHAKIAAADAQALVAHIQRGKGTVGALVMDESVYDDIQELLRDIKHNPWKLFWRQ